MLVVDASVAIAWFVPDELSPEADDVLRRVREDGAIVPALFRWEIQNALQHIVSSNRIRLEDAEAAFDALASLPIAVEDCGGKLFVGSEARLAMKNDITAYDAAYLALALDRNLPLATADHALEYAARSNGVETIFID